MSEEPFLELAPLAALGALDGDDHRAFDEHIRKSVVCRAELAAFEWVAACIPLALDPVPPAAGVREQVLKAVAPAGPHPAPAAPTAWLFPALATAAALVMGIGYVVVRGERDVARRDAEGARAALAAFTEELRKAQDDAAAVRKDLGAVRDLVAHPDSRTARLAALPPAGKAVGRVVWDPGSRRAVLLVTGLEPAPEGKAYEVWVIAHAAPVPAGVFQVASDGSAVLRLPVVDETARVKTFAVTLEPEAGTKAPTGPMVLAGSAS